MPIDDISRATQPDWGAIESGNRLEIANTLSLLFMMLTTEINTRLAQRQTLSSVDRQDRLQMMAIYS